MVESVGLKAEMQQKYCWELSWKTRNVSQSYSCQVAIGITVSDRGGGTSKRQPIYLLKFSRFDDIYRPIPIRSVSRVRNIKR